MNKAKILVVEDEPIVALDIKNAIARCGFSVTDIVDNYDDALLSVQINEPDIIFMDINLENSKDGIEIAIEIKKRKDIPIIYLTAYSDNNTMQRAIETNPLNFIAKPFKREELKSSILMSLYKINNLNNQNNYKHIHIGSDYYFDLEHSNLYFKDQPIQLSINEKKFLKILIEADGQIVNFDVIQEEIWPESDMSDSAFRTLLYRLRIKLEYKLIETIPSFGYKLNK